MSKTTSKLRQVTTGGLALAAASVVSLGAHAMPMDTHAQRDVAAPDQTAAKQHLDYRTEDLPKVGFVQPLDQGTGGQTAGTVQPRPSGNYVDPVTPEPEPGMES